MRFQQVLHQSGAALRTAPLVSIGGLNGLMLLVNVSISLLLVRYLPKEAYGQVVYFYAGVGLTRLLMNFGLGQYINREIASLGTQADALRRAVYSTLAIRGASIALMWLIILLVNAFGSQPFLFHIALAGFFASLADMALAIISGLRLTTSIALITASQPILYALSAIAYMVLGQASAELLMLLVALSYLGTAVAAGRILARSGNITAFQRGDLNAATIRRILLSAFPIYLISLISQLYLSINGGALGARGDYIASANYGAAFNLITMTLTLSAGALLTVFLPQIAQLTAAGDCASLLKQIRNAVTLSLRIYLFISVLIAAFPETVVSLLFGAQYERSAVYLLGLAPLPVILSLSSLFTQVLISQHRQWLAVLGLGVQTLFLIFMINGAPQLMPSTLVEGALLSSIIGALLLITATVWALKALPFRWVDAAAVGLALISALILRQVQLAIGAELSPWHFAVGTVFLLVYGAGWLITEKIQWRAPSHLS